MRIPEFWKLIAEIYGDVPRLEGNKRQVHVFISLVTVYGGLWTPSLLKGTAKRRRRFRLTRLLDSGNRSVYVFGEKFQEERRAARAMNAKPTEGAQ